MSFNTSSASTSIYTARDANVRKGDWYQCIKDSGSGFESTFVARDKSRHALKRRILSPVFSERALRDYEPRIKLLIEKWLLALTAISNDGGNVDFAAWANYVIFDILGDLCYSKDFGLVNFEENRYVTKLLPQCTRGWYMLGYHPWTHLLRHLLFKTVLKSSLGRIVTRYNSEFRDFCVTALKERVKTERTSGDTKSASTDMFHQLLKARDPETGEGFSMGDLGSESVLLMIAGTHTTSVAIAAIVFYLAKNKESLDKVKAEVRDAFASTENMDYRQLAKLPYLRACINESLRLCPPTAGHLQREALSAGAEIDGKWYPPGTNLGISAYALQRNPAIWKDPDTFYPERWLPRDSQSLQSSQSGLIAFSSGPLGCPGKQLAYMEMTLVIAMLISRFDIALDEADAIKQDYVIKDCYVGQAEGPHVVLHTRPSLPR
jgi:cytochrome P450